MRLLILGALFSTAAFASYFPPSEGWLLEGFTEKSRFELSPGVLKNCDSKSVGSSYFQHCDVTQATASVTDTKGTSLQFQFDRVHIRFASVKATGPFREYIFTGSWKDPGTGFDTSTRLVVWYPTNDSNHIRGSLSLKKLGLTRPVHISPK